MLNKHGIDFKAISRDQKAIDKLPNRGRASVNHSPKSKALAKKAGKSKSTGKYPSHNYKGMAGPF